MAADEVKEAPKNTNIPSITILDSDDEQEQTTEELFQGFIEAVEPFLKRKELLVLRVKFQALCPDFKCSSRFKDMLRRKANQVHKVDVYIHFNEVLNAIISNAAVYGKKGMKTTQEEESSDDDNSGVQEDGTQESRHETLAGNFENIEENSSMEATPLNRSSESIDSEVQFVEETKSSQPSSSGNLQNPSSSNEKRNIEKEIMKMKRKKLIAKLEAKLKYTSDEIKRLSQAELSLDEMEFGDSSYIMESRLKNRFNSIWNKLCKLKGRPTSTGRVVEGSIKCKTSGFPAIDRAMEKFLKKRRGFPDIFDIRNIIIRVNKKHGLELTQGVQNDIAADILTDIGNKLQKKRKKDFEYNFGCHLTDDCLPSLDPALHNSELRQKLDENKRVNKDALDNVFQKYVHLGRVKGSKNHGTDSNTPSESDSESEKESYRRNKRKERESSSEDDSKDESPKKKHRKNKSSSENRKEKPSVNVSTISTMSATENVTSITESGSVEVENSNSKDENNSTLSSNGELTLVIGDTNDEVHSTVTTSVMPTSVPEEEKYGSPEVEESAQPPSQYNGKLEESQDWSIENDRERNEVQDSFALNSPTSEEIEPYTKAPSPQVTKSKPETNTAPEQVNGFGQDDEVIEIFDNDEESVKSHKEKEKIKNDKNVQKQNPKFNSRKLLVKIQQLKENQLSRFELNRSLTNSSVAGSSEKVDSCHSKRKGTKVRHITQNQEHVPNSPSNGIIDEPVPHHNDKEINQVDNSESQMLESDSKIPITSTTTSFSPKKDGQGLQESLKNCPSITLKNNSVLKTDINTATQHRFSDISEQRNSLLSELQGQKDRIPPPSSVFTPNGKTHSPKPVETIIILSDDEDD